MEQRHRAVQGRKQGDLQEHNASAEGEQWMVLEKIRSNEQNEGLDEDER